MKRQRSEDSHEFEQDPVTEVAEVSQREDRQGHRPPAIVLRGRTGTRSPAQRLTTRTNLTDRPVVLRPAVHSQYPPTRIDRLGTCARVAPASASVRPGSTSYPVRRDLYSYGQDPYDQADKLWCDPQAVSSILIPDPDIVTSLEQNDASTEEEEATADCDRGASVEEELGDGLEIRGDLFVKGETIFSTDYLKDRVPRNREAEGAASIALQ